MTAEGLKSNRGVALLITLSIITILVTAGLQLNRKTKATVDGAAAQKDRYTLRQMATGAINIAMAMLIKDAMETKVDSVQEDWANPQVIEEMLAEFPFGDGKVSLIITDELSRIQINALINYQGPNANQFKKEQLDLWKNLTEKLLKLYKESGEDLSEMEETDPETIINSIKDWLDSKDDDAVTGLSGAESDYYKGLDPPYECKNGPFSHIGEVALVKGITPELFSGIGELFGLSSLLTVYGATDANAPPQKDSANGSAPPPDSFGPSSGGFGEDDGGKFTFDGRININTAELPILMALLPIEAAEFAKNIVEFRLLKSEDDKYVNDLSDPGWYKNVPGFTGIDIDESIITVNSDFFRITATASRHSAKLTLSAVVQREKSGKNGKWQCKILNWQTE